MFKLHGVLARSFHSSFMALVGMATLSLAESSSAQSETLRQQTVTSVQRTESERGTRIPRVTSIDYFDAGQGATSSDLIRRALTSNAEIAAARIDVERSRARLRQAGLRPNPILDFEQTTGRLTGSAGERQTSIGLSLPIQLGGKRARRIELAQAELEAAEAEIADRERRLGAGVRTAYAEALTALRELETTDGLTNLDQQTARIVEVRVTEGDTPPLELNLLRVEIDRLRSRRALAEGRLQAALLQLKNIAGIPAGESLRLREDLDQPALPGPPPSSEEAINVALNTRPDLRLARLTEEVTQAGLRLAKAQATPDVAPFARHSVNRSTFDTTPVGPISDSDQLLTFGISISLPLFNRNQGAQAEAAAAITQARRRREFVETVVRTEVTSAYARYQAATLALDTFEQGVLERSVQNIRALRGAYEIGAFRITDLLAEQRRFMDSQREFIEALAAKYRALADLQAAMGAPVNP